MTIALANFENGLPARNIIPAVAVDKDEPAKTVHDEVIEQASQHIQISARRSRKSSWEIEMVIGISEPHQRRPDHFIAQAFLRATNDFAKKHAVRKERQMVAMLLEGRDGEND